MEADIQAILKKGAEGERQRQSAERVVIHSDEGGDVEQKANEKCEKKAYKNNEKALQVH